MDQEGLKAAMLRFRFRRYLVLFFATSLPLAAQQGSAPERFSYTGDVFFQGFFLARDLPLVRQTAPVCRTGLTAARAVVPAGSATSVSTVPARCREEEDFYRLRFRLNMVVRPSPYADIVYGLEVGYLTFGRENKDGTGTTIDYGPGSGGRGAGRTNLETRELLLRLHDKADSLSLNMGVLNFGTPKGIVAATSGGGLKFNADLTKISSSLEAVYVRAIDNSRIDDDSNGYSDRNFAEVSAGTFSWKYSGIRSLRTDLYGAFYSDSDPSANDPTEKERETSRTGWGGLFVQWTSGRWKAVLHGIANKGYFERPFAFSPTEQTWARASPELTAINDQRIALEAAGTTNVLRRRYLIDAKAGQAEISVRVTDRLEVIGEAAGASGRFPSDVEPDGNAAALRKDQFRTFGAFQMSDLALDSSGGYSAISNGRLTGTFVRSLGLKAQLSSTLEGQLTYYSIELIHTPTIERNQFYSRYRQIGRSSNYFGQELDVRLAWRAFADFQVEGRAALFDAGAAYKIVRDVEYGDRLFEASIAVSQKF